VNTLVLRTKFGGNPSFTDLLSQVREVALSAYAYQDVPFEQLVEQLQPERSLSYAPLFQVMFVLQNAPIPLLQLPGLTLTPLRVESFTAKFDLTLSLENSAQGLSGSIEYNTDLFDASTITRMVGHLQTLLQGLVANPDQKLKHIPLLSAAEQHQILSEWNNTLSDYPKQLCLHELFEQQVQKTPDAVAVVFSDKRLTYSELNTLANQLAHYLLELGVGPEVLVGVCVERSLEMVVALLGILKAGGAYVPIDPEYPQERLAYMLEDSQVKVLLTESKLVARLGEQQAHLVCLDTDWQAISNSSQENPRSGVLPNHLAYVIYTSGSTGKPKGAMNTHQGVCNRLLWMQQAYVLTPLDSVLQKTPFSFDVSVWEFFWPLLSGARLVVAQPGGHRDSAYLVKLIAQHQITTLHFVPSMLQVFLEEQGLSSCSCLRQVFCSGEALPKELQEKFFARLGCSLHNLYGPTEAAIDVTYWQCQPDSDLLTVPIGRPIANTQIYILDPHGKPVPVGVTGELHIGGVGVARGYLNRPQLTAEKFIPNPFASDKASERLYKTGDLVRYLPDGNIEYLGRIDHQVKVRGFRIELGEIEAVLSQHPNVRQTVVIATQEMVGATRLVAYLVANQQPAPTIGELRSFLKQKLPEYMVPSAFVVLDSLPLTPNGKLDRKALPDPELAQPELEKTFVAPRTPTEEVLAQIWTQVLRLERVGVTDNFFDLGGHSLTATQLLFRVRNTFKVELPLHALLETPTVAGMAEAIDNVRDCKPTPPATISVTDLNTEAVLDDTIRPASIAVDSIAQPARIFLTGATGFLGAFLLYELLQQTDADIHCLVRSNNVQQGKKKIQANLESYSLWNECFSSRIIPVIGDLSQPLFGLGDQQFQLLASTIDVIYHNGALVNFVEPYPKLKAANVLGTQEVLRLASQIKVKPVHYVSTISVFPWEEDFSKEHIFRENDSLDRGSLAGGYGQSKWVAEKLVIIARTRGLPVCIYRPGTVSGHSQTGTSNTNDLMARMIKGCIQLGSIPDFNMTVDLTPVDYASRCIVHLSMQKKSLGETFHVVNPHPVHWSNIITWFRSFGYSLEVISYDKWRAELLKVAEHSSENALYPLIPFFVDEAPDDSIKFDCRNTLNGLAGTSINCPSVSAELLNTYFSYYIRSGFL
jgi:amino acid adenylation domain-containing protein/thioester reductase-like protein